MLVYQNSLFLKLGSPKSPIRAVMASTSTAKQLFDDKIANCFLMKNRNSVPSKKFTNVVINSCDGSQPIPFSDARIDFNTGPSVILALFWHESICRIMLKKVLSNTTTSEDDLFHCLVSLLLKDDHKQHLLKLNNSLSEAEIQSVLAHHLFAPLVPSSKYKIDARHKRLTNCYACKERSCIGDTSFGHIDIWHGYADILIEKSSVKVKVNSIADEEENDESCSEPKPKIFRVGDGDSAQLGSDGEESSDSMDFSGSMSIEVKKGNMNEALPQVFAQTIVNAFCEVKKNPHLADYYIPSFLASPTCVMIHMYNCKRDRLYSSEDLPIFDASGKELNFETIISIWLALNFDRLATIIPDDEFVKGHIPTCNFRNAVGDALNLYQNELSKPLKGADYKRSKVRQFDFAAEFVTMRTEFLNKMSESLQNVQTVYEKMKGSSTGQQSFK